MGMVDRYKKNGGFVQLLQVLETCGSKKYDQFMSVISEEDPSWAIAIKEKMLTFDKIINWKPEAILEILAQVNSLTFSTALKGQSPEQLANFMEAVGNQGQRKIEQQMSELQPTPIEISSCMMKVISEARTMLAIGTLKAAKVDAQLVIPEGFEDKLSSKDSRASLGIAPEVGPEFPDTSVAPLPAPAQSAFAAGTGGAMELDKIQKKFVLLSRDVQQLKQENSVLKDKLEKIKKIA